MEHMVRKHIFFYGSVEMEVQGTEEKIGELILFLERQRYIEITNMDVKTQPLKEERDFYERGY